MMKVKFFAYLRDYTHTKEIEVAYCPTLRELLHELGTRFGSKLNSKLFKNDQLSDEIIVLINGVHILHLNGIDSVLQEGDEISIFPVVAGG